MAFLTTALIIATATLAGGALATTYHSTNGFGLGNKVKSSLDFKREQEAKQMQTQLQNTITSNGRYFMPVENKGLVGTRPSSATRPTQPTKPTLPTIQTLPTLQTGYHWQEYELPKNMPPHRASELFLDRTDTYANNGPISALGNIFRGSKDFLPDKSKIPRWALALATLGFSETYANVASAIDNLIWDINADGRDSMLKNVFVDPWIEVSQGTANFGQALLGTGLNALSATSELFDVLANPIKGLASDGWRGFVNGMGAGGNGYVAYSWDTGHFASDLMLEIFSDPLMYINVAKWGTSVTNKISRRLATRVGKDIALDSVSKISAKTLRSISNRVNYGMRKNMGRPVAGAYSRKLADIVVDKSNKGLKVLGGKLSAGSVQTLSYTSRKLTLNRVPTIQKVEDIYTPTTDVVNATVESILQDILNTARKAQIPLDASTIQGVKRSIIAYLKAIDLNDMTAQIIGTTGVLQKQAKLMQEPKALEALIAAQEASDTFQRKLSKLAYYTIFPEVPLLYNVLKTTPLKSVMDLVSKRTVDIMTAVASKLTNRAAYNFQKGLEKAFKKLTPENYALLRRTYSWSSTDIAKVLADNVKVGSKKLITKNRMLPQTSAGAFQRIWLQKFEKDTAMLQNLTYNKSSTGTDGYIQDIKDDWEAYLLETYGKTPEEYLKFLESINELEQDLSGTAVYSTYINRIKSINNLLETSYLYNLMKESPEDLVKIVSIKPTASKALPKHLLDKLGIYTISKEEFAKTKSGLIEDQVFRQTNNKVYVNYELYNLFKKEVQAFLDNQKCLLKELCASDTVDYIEHFVEHFERVMAIQQCFDLIASSPGLYINLPENIKPDLLYIAITDSFMGLNNKITDLNDIDGIVYEIASIAELQLKAYTKSTKDLTGLLTQDIDFISTLRTIIDLYVGGLPKNAPFVTEVKDVLSDLRAAAERLYIPLPSHLNIDPKSIAKLNDLIEQADHTISDLSSELLIIPPALLRSDMDLDNVNSIHECLLKAAEGRYAGTLTPISDGRNLSMFFDTVPKTNTYDRGVVLEMQELANASAKTYDKIYNKTMLTEATEVIDNAWSAILDRLGKSPDAAGPIQQIIAILQYTKDLPALKKYALLRTLATYSNPKFSLLMFIKNVVNEFADAPARKQLNSLLHNFNRCTNKPVTVGVGLSVQRANDMVLTPSNLQVYKDLKDIQAEQAQVQRSIASLEAQIKNISNSDPMLAQHLVHAKKLNAFYDNQIKYYQQVINASINYPLMDRIVARMTQALKDPKTAHLFSKKDLATLRAIYRGDANIRPDRINQLITRVEGYNKATISPDLFHLEITAAIDSYVYLHNITKNHDFSYADFVRVWEKLNRHQRLTKSERHRFEAVYEPIIEDYNYFSRILTDPDITESELKQFLSNSHLVSKMEANKLIPVALQMKFLQEYALSSGIHINFRRTNGLAKSEYFGYSVVLPIEGLQDIDKLLYNFRHETVHSSLRGQDYNIHTEIVQNFWRHLMEGPNKEFIEQFYKAIFYHYLDSLGPHNHYFNGNSVFSFDNVKIQEEVMANIIASAGHADVPQIQYEKYSEAVKSHRKDIDPFLDVKYNFDPETADLINTYYDSLMQDLYFANPKEFGVVCNVTPAGTSYSFPDNIFPLHQGVPIDISSPFAAVGDIMHDFNNASKNRTSSMMRKRLRQSPEELAQDLARTGPFHFYSMSGIRSAGGKYSLHYYFDEDFNVRPAIKAQLDKLGIGIVKIPELDTLMFYINKDKVIFSDGASYYDRQRVTYPNLNFNYKSDRWKMLEKADSAYQDAMTSITGTPLGYSNGFRVDNNFMNTLFNGTQDGFSTEYPTWPGLNNMDIQYGGWTLEDFAQPIYYPTIRFNEMILGPSSFARRFGVYISNNPIVNMSNSIQQAHMMSKTKTEMLMLFFDDTFSTNKEGIWGKYSDEDLYQAYLNHPDYVLVTMRGKSKKQQLIEQDTNIVTKTFLGSDWNTVRLQEFIPYSVQDIKKAREIGARFVPKAWYNAMYNTINNRIGSGGLLKWFNKYNFIYKCLLLAPNIMTFVRNGIDTFIKNNIELKDETMYWTGYAYKMKQDYQDIQQALFNKQIVGDKDIRKFFDSGESLAYTHYGMTYQMFKDIQEYEAWGPSTRGLADLIQNSARTGSDQVLEVTDKMDPITRAKIEPSTDELTRRIAKEYIPEYKGLWERITEFTNSYFDFANKYFGADIEKASRLALYLKSISEGKTKTEAFQWITKTHFDYTTSNLYEQVSEVLMPFITFTAKNLLYWMERIIKDPTVQRFLTNYFQAEWNYYDFDSEEMAASNQWQFLIKSGNIPLNKEGNIQNYFKLNPSFADAFNTFINPIEVLKDRLIFPTRAIEKSTTEDYRGQNLMGKQPIWNQIMDWTSSLPGNALARRITNAIKKDDTLSTIGELSGATGQIYLNDNPYIPGRTYGYRQQINYVYNNDFQTQSTIKAQAFKITASNKRYRYDAMAINRYKHARGTDLGRRILNPNTLSGQNLTKNLYFNYNLYKPNANYKRTYKRNFTANQYRIQHSMYR